MTNSAKHPSGADKVSNKSKNDRMSMYDDDMA